MLSTEDIVNIATVAAGHMKDPAPTAIQYTNGTRAELNELVFGATIGGADGQRPSVLVQTTGNFTWIHSAPFIPGRKPNNTSNGTAFYLIIDQETGAVTDRGMRSKPIDLSRLGHVVQTAVPKEHGAG